MPEVPALSGACDLEPGWLTIFTIDSWPTSYIHQSQAA
jgi:hypothetical protein